MTTFAERREQLAFLSRTLEREAHILSREPEVLPSHLHNMLYLDGGDEGAVGLLLARAREALAGRPWLRLTNRPEIGSGRSALLRVLAHRAQVSALAWSPDGSLLASVGETEGIIRLWEVGTGKLVTEVPVHEVFEWRRSAETGRLVAATFKKQTSWVEVLAWSPDGKTLASGGRDFAVRLWDPTTGRCRAILGEHEGHVLALAWSPDGTVLASGSRDKTIRLWGGNTGEPLAALNRHTSAVNALAWSPDGDRIASGGGDGRIYFWDASTMKVRASVGERMGEITALAWSADSRTLASAENESGAVRLWDGATGELRGLLHGHKNGLSDGGVLALAWWPSETLASAGRDRSVRLWDVATRRADVLMGPAQSIEALAWSPNGETLASGSWGEVRVWDALAAAGQTTADDQQERVSHVEWSPDGRTLAVKRGNKVSFCDASRGQLLATLEHEPTERKRPSFLIRRAGNKLMWSPDGRALVWGDIVYLWSEQVHGYEVRIEEATALAWTPDPPMLATAHEDGPIQIWDLVTGRVRATLRGDGMPVRALAWSPDGRTLASAGQRRTVRLWDAQRGEAWAVLEGHLHSVEALAWSPDARTLASADSGGSIHLWNPATLQRRVALKAYANKPLMEHVSSLVWSPDGGTLVCGYASDSTLGSSSLPPTLCLCDPVQGECWASFKYGEAPLWSPDSRALAFAGVRLCYPGDRRIATLDVFPGWVDRYSQVIEAKAWSPNSRVLALGSRDKSVRLFDTMTGRALSLAHCLSPIAALQFSVDGRILRAADNGAATGNRPIPYLFEPCNVEIGPPVEPPRLAPRPPPQGPERRPGLLGRIFGRRR